MIRRGTVMGLLVAGMGLLAMFAAPVVHADATTGDLYYTTFSGDADGGRLFKITYTFDGVTLSFGSEVQLSSEILGLTASDGVVFDPTNSNLVVVGGQFTNQFFSVDLTTGIATPSGAIGGIDDGIYHLAVDPNLTSVWGSGIPGSPIANITLTGAGFGGSFTKTISGANLDSPNAITGIAFLPLIGGGTQAYYTASDADGGSGVANDGSFGTIDLTTGATTELYDNIPAAHGLIFDPFTGDLILTGDSQIRKYDPDLDSFQILNVAGNQFDQAAVDGKGHLFVASNDSDLFFLDYSATSDISDVSNFSTTKSGFKLTLDDVAPLTRPSSEQPVPEPMTGLLFGFGGLAFGFVNRRKRVA